MLKGESLLGYTNLFSPRKEWLNITKIFSITKKVKIKRIFCVICDNYKKSRSFKTSYLFEKTLALSFIYSECENGDWKIFKEEEESI